MTTKEEILKRLKERVSNSVDKREGSVIHDALAPSSVEFESSYQYVNTARANTFAGTADREHLIKRCAEIGISPFEATYARRKGIFTPAHIELKIGERFSYESLNFMVIEKLEAGVYSLQCEELGEVGNYGEGRLIPIEYVNGLETATLSSEVLVYGEDEEDTEVLRERYFDTLLNRAMDGNVAQYKKWCGEYKGIGNSRIFSLWNGKNTVKVSILSSENTQASQELIDEFQEFLDPESNGLGEGQAPIGAIVTVSTPPVKNIDVQANVVYRRGYTHYTTSEESIRKYLRSLNYASSIVSYVAISALFLDDPAIEVVLDLNINGAKNNVPIGEEEIVDLNKFTIVEGA